MGITNFTGLTIYPNRIKSNPTKTLIQIESYSIKLNHHCHDSNSCHHQMDFPGCFPSASYEPYSIPSSLSFSFSPQPYSVSSTPPSFYRNDGAETENARLPDRRRPVRLLHSLQLRRIGKVRRGNPRNRLLREAGRLW